MSAHTSRDSPSGSRAARRPASTSRQSEYSLSEHYLGGKSWRDQSVRLGGYGCTCPAARLVNGPAFRPRSAPIGKICGSVPLPNREPHETNPQSAIENHQSKRRQRAMINLSETRICADRHGLRSSTIPNQWQTVSLFLVALPDGLCYDCSHSMGDAGCCESVRQMARAEPRRPRRLLCQEPEDDWRTGCSTYWNAARGEP